jgi:hypothetical protein
MPQKATTFGGLSVIYLIAFPTNSNGLARYLSILCCSKRYGNFFGNRSRTSQIGDILGHFRTFDLMIFKASQQLEKEYQKVPNSTISQGFVLSFI